jgi:fatty acid desaturase
MPGLIAFSSNNNLQARQRIPNILYKNLIDQALWDQDNLFRQKIDRLNSVKYTLLAMGGLLAIGLALYGSGGEPYYYSLLEPFRGAYLMFLTLYFWYVIVGFFHHGLLESFKRLLWEMQQCTSEWLASLPDDVKEI